MLIEYHRTMIADTVRNDAFQRALAQVIVRDKSTVLDIGGGTGILGFMAKKLGAKSVTMIESGPIGGVAHKLMKANKLQGIDIIPGHSTETMDIGQFDIIVSETLGNFAYEENIISTLNDARRFLKPGGIMMPQKIRHMACPVVSPRFHEELTAWSRTGTGLDFSIAQKMSLNNVYVRTFLPEDLFEDGRVAKPCDNADFTDRKEKRTRRSFRTSWRMLRRRTFYGFALWWECTLAPGVTLSTSPFAPRTHWEQLYFPFETPIEAHMSEDVAVSITSDSSYEGGTNLTWSVTRMAKFRQTMDLRNGWLS